MKLDDERYRTLRLPRPGFLLKRLLRRSTLDRAQYRDAALSGDERATLDAVTTSAQRVFDDRRLVFVYGVMPRSGTNFLFELLLRVAPFVRSEIPFAELPILAGEEYFAGPGELIGRVHPDSAAAFSRMEWMAYAIAGFRNRLLDIAAPGSITLIKNPLVWNIELWPVFFPQDKMVFIVRDARYIVDSFARSFAHGRLARTFEDICIETALAIEKSNAFTASMPADQLLEMRYEEVVADKRGAVATVKAWLGEAMTEADAGALENVPVFGSSTHSKRTAGGGVDWTPVAADAKFDPTSRPLDWSPAQRRTFERVCGDLNAAMGYPRTA